MSEIIECTINSKICIAKQGQYILSCAKDNGIYIPSLCNIEGIVPRGSCRVCTVLVNGRYMTACTTPVSGGMKIQTDTEELDEIRKGIVELLFAEGNHFCPSCERSGNCELQALAYRFKIAAPRYPLLNPVREIEAANPRLIKDHNRCILCKRCIRAIKDKDGRSLFAFKKRSHRLSINIDTKLSSSISDQQALKAMEVCPVGAILKKEKGFDVPIGKRTYDKEPIGWEIEKNSQKTPK